MKDAALTVVASSARLAVGLRRWLHAANSRAKATVHRLFPENVRFAGAWPTYEQAVRAVPAGKLAGYDHDDLAEVSFTRMCRIETWDYPVLFWMQKLLAHHPRVLDAGGHMGTKYRAFSRLLDLGAPVDWTVYDLPRIVAAGRRRAHADNLYTLHFIDDLAHAPPVDILLASGLLQYLDVPIDRFLARLGAPPRYVILNKISVRNGPTVVTHENFGTALVPYQMRNLGELTDQIEMLGYDIIDQWSIPELAHKIATHPELGSSQSIGICLRLKQDKPLPS